MQHGIMSEDMNKNTDFQEKGGHAAQIQKAGGSGGK